MAKPLVFDIETQNSFRDVNNDTKKLKVSVVVCYDYGTNSYYHFLEKELSSLFALFERASLIIGYNSNSFDLVVLNEYYVGNLFKFPRFDLLESIKEKSGRRYSLDDIVRTTISAGKSGNGLKAIELYQTGQIDKLISYCQDDVKLTKELFDFGIKNGFIYAPTLSNKTRIEVNWKQVWEKANTNHSATNLSFEF